MKSTKYSFRENSDDLNKIKNFFNVDKENKAIHKSIKLVFLNSKYSCINTYSETEIKKFYSQKMQKKDKSITITLKDADMESLYLHYKLKKKKNKKQYIAKFSPSEAIHCLVNEMSIIIDEVKDVSNILKSMYYMLGQKNELMCSELNKIFAIAGKNCNEYAEPFTGTSNVFFHLNSMFNKYSLNDLNTRTVNFLKVLRDNPTNLKLRLLNLELTKDKFNELKNYEVFVNDADNTNEVVDIDDAVAFFYTRYMSLRGNEKTFYSARSESNNAIANYRETVNRITALSEKLANVNITSIDAFKFIKKQLGNPNLLLYVDSPYPYTEDYYNFIDKKTGKKVKIQFNHKKLAELLLKFTGQFVYSCRLTFSIGKKSKGYPDNEMVRTIDILYKNKDFYYKDVHLKGPAKGQIERIITNFDFEGATKYE